VIVVGHGDVRCAVAVDVADGKSVRVVVACIGNRRERLGPQCAIGLLQVHACVVLRSVPTSSRRPAGKASRR
jgi:hypothetical protein